MMIKEIIKVIEEKFPKKMSEEWDNVGLLIGDLNNPVKKIMLTLDCTMDAIDKAIEEKVDLIIAHHPLIFSSIKTINTGTILGKKIIKLIENKIAVYGLHTNLDSSPEGLNSYIGEYLGFGSGRILEEKELNGIEYGIGRFYKINSIEFEELIKGIKNKLNLSHVSVVAPKENKKITKLAIVNGSGANYWRMAKKMGAEVLITGDVKYHEALDAKEENMSIVDIGHYEGEIIYTDILENLLKNICENIIIFKGQPVFKNI